MACIPIEFDVANLITILWIKDEGLELYSSRKELKFVRYTHVDTFKNICRHSDLFDDVCNIQFPAQYLCLQVQIFTAYFNIWSVLGGHAHQVTCLYVTLLKCILRGAKVNFEYAINNRSLPFGGFITRILSILEFQLMSPHLTPQRKWGWCYSQFRVCLGK